MSWGKLLFHREQRAKGRFHSIFSVRQPCVHIAFSVGVSISFYYYFFLLFSIADNKGRVSAAAPEKVFLSECSALFMQLLHQIENKWTFQRGSGVFTAAPLQPTKHVFDENWSVTPHPNNEENGFPPQLLWFFLKPTYKECDKDSKQTLYPANKKLFSVHTMVILLAKWSSKLRLQKTRWARSQGEKFLVSFKATAAVRSNSATWIKSRTKMLMNNHALQNFGNLAPNNDNKLT